MARLRKAAKACGAEPVWVVRASSATPLRCPSVRLYILVLWPGVLDWLPAHWVSARGPGRRRAFGAARHLAVVAEERAQAATLAHQSATASNVQSAGWSIVADGDAAAASDLSDSGGPVLALQWTKVR